MKEKPILFSPPMVKAILENRKTMTRRIFKMVMKKYVAYRNHCAEILDDSREPLSEKEFYEVNSPYQKGDILWVRETFAWPHVPPSLTKHPENPAIYYKADFSTKLEGFKPKWKPSIHMPREATRLFLKVLSVRVERLQDIIEEDAIREGMPESMTGASDYSIRCFHSLWDSLNAKPKRGYSWENNPWVWVIEFERIEK